MKIKVTDQDTGETTVYDLSSDNWRKVPACMRNGAVHMWAPPELPPPGGGAIITSGRRWEALKD